MAVLSPIVTAILNNKIDHIQVLLTVIIINSLKRVFNSLHTFIVLQKLVHLPIFLLKSSARLSIWLRNFEIDAMSSFIGKVLCVEKPVAPVAISGQSHAFVLFFQRLF